MLKNIRHPDNIFDITREIGYNKYMEQYIAYKAWWIATQAKYKIGTNMNEHCAHAECLFKQHIDDLGFYGLMELLSEWKNEDE